MSSFWHEVLERAASFWIMGSAGFVLLYAFARVTFLPASLNCAYGVTSVSFREYTLATAVGIIPGTLAAAWMIGREARKALDART